MDENAKQKIDYLLDGLRELDIEKAKRLLGADNWREQLRANNYDETYLLVIFASAVHSDGGGANSCRHTEILELIKNKMGKEFWTLATELDDGRSLVHLAAASNCKTFLNKLKQLGLAMDNEDNKKWTPLCCAAFGGATASIKFLKEIDCNLHHRDKKGQTPLHLACEYLHIDAVRVMEPDKRMVAAVTKSGANAIFTVLSARCDKSVAHSDSNSGKIGGRCTHFPILDYFREKLGNDEFKKLLHAKTNEGATAIHYAVSSNCRLLPEFLHSNGCQLDEADNDGDTALCSAATSGSEEIVEALVELGCNIEHKNDKKETPLLLACKGNEFGVARLLVEKNANMTVRDEEGNSALLLTATNLAAYGSEALGSELYVSEVAEFVNWLTDKMKEKAGIVDPYQEENFSNENFLLKLADDGCLELLSSLKSLNERDYMNEDGVNILHVTAENQSLGKAFIRFKDNNLWTELLEKRVSSGDYKGFTTLHFACLGGNVGNINYLLSNCPEMLAKTRRSKAQSPLKLLIEGGNKALLPELTIQLEKIISGIDATESALTLPTDKEAKLILRPYCDKQMRRFIIADAGKKKREKKKDDKGGEFSAVVRLFYTAFKCDSVQMFRSLITQGLWAKFDSEEAHNFKRYLLTQMEQNSHEKHRALASKALPSIRGFRYHFRQWKRVFGDWKDSRFDASSLPGPLELAVKTGRTQIAKDLIIMEQQHLIPTCLRVMDECAHLKAFDKSATKHAKSLSEFSSNVLLNAMKALDKAADEEEVRLLHAYMAGRFREDSSEGPKQFGPKFNCFSGKKPRSVYDLIIRNWTYELLASDCVTKFVDVEWRTVQKSECGMPSVPPRIKFGIHCVFFAIFMAIFTYFACMLQKGVQWVDILMFCFAASFFMQEVMEFARMIQTTRNARQFIMGFEIPKYVSRLVQYIFTAWNMYDILGVLTLVTGLIWKLAIDTSEIQDATDRSYYGIRILLSVSYLFWCMRSLYFLRAFSLLGPFVSMLKTLLQRDLVPFLILFGIVSLAFGVLFFNLLLPDSRQFDKTGRRGTRDLMNLFSVYTRPLLLGFGHLEIEEMIDCSNSSASWSEEDGNVTATCTHPVGSFLYSRFVIFFFLFFVNLTLLNMLIAKFSLTVSSKDDKAHMIWRHYQMQILSDYQDALTLPPPLTLLELPYALIHALFAFYKKTNKVGDIKKSWWRRENVELFNVSTDLKSSLNGRDSSDASESAAETSKSTFAYFLLFQAVAFAGKRSRFPMARADHGAAVDKLKTKIQQLQQAIREIRKGNREQRQNAVTVRCGFDH